MSRFQVHARGDLDQPHALGGELKDAAFGDVETGWSFSSGVTAAEGDVLHLLDELARLALAARCSAGRVRPGFQDRRR